MSNLSTCHGNLVGITQRDCDCFPNDAETFNITESTSGIYVDQFIDLKSVSYERCGEDGSVLARINNDLQQAYKDVEADIVKGLTDPKVGYKPIANYKDTINPDRFRNTLVETATYKGEYFKLKPMRGGKIRVVGVYLAFDTTKTFNVFLKGTSTNTLITKSVTSEANQWKYSEFNSAVEFDLTNYDSPDENFGFAIYHSESGMKDNKIDCGCGAKPKWRQYFKEMGFATSSQDIDDIANSGSTDYAYGMRPVIEIDCELSFTLCQFQGDAKRSLAYAVARRTAIHRLTDMVNSGDVNKWTVYMPDLANAKIEENYREYFENIDYLVGLSQSSECFRCEPKVMKRSIRV